DLNDYLEHTGSLGLERLFGRDSTLSLTYNYTEHDEDGNGSGGIDDLGGEDFTQHNVMLELAHQVGHRLTLEAGLGWVAIDYDSSDYGSMNEIVWNLGAEYLLSDRVTSSLSYTRDYITSVDQGVALEDEARVRLSYGKRLTAGLELFANRLKYKEADIEDRIAGALWDLHVPVGRRLYLDFGFEYGILRFLPEKEDSQRYEATASVGGAWRHLNLDLEYRFRHEDSDLRENTFHNNVAVLTLGWTF
ncbi:MAG: TonB-dependent receptor, partial [Deltaproteobacteria bacterium]|nr:TonB-dependent receptor [Candidatus Anaeroferrophillacea bacterium]